MKLNFTKKFLTVLLCFMTVLGMMFLVSCGDKTGGDTTGSGGSSNESGSGSTGDNDVLPEKLQLDDSKSVIKSESPNTVASPVISEEDLSQLYTVKFTEELNPEYDSRTESLDNIFNPDALGQMVLVFDRSEWNKHLSYCDYSLSHEESVVVKGFYFTKDNKEWFFNDIGFRIRGNTSRRRPQEGNEAGKNDYVQAHFALDFEEWIPKGEDKKLADCMKGIILKRFKDDATYSREVYAYNLFRQNGIWIAPRAAYTTLKIQIIDDLDLDADGNTSEFETVDYGVYAMVEEIKKQFLKERTEKEGGGYLSSNKGNLWKCLWKSESEYGPNFVKNDANSIGEEDVSFTFADEDRTIIKDSTNKTYDYDYKGDNDLEEGRTQILAFMEELNNLPNCTDGVNDSADKEKITKFYNEKMAGDLFLRTYAINVVLGMWDDYWINKNNFYFYFDEDEKAYFIPYDYDNSLGVCHLGVDVGKANPYTWGNLTDGKHPLIQKILQVPEYMKLYQKYLLEYSNENSFFDDDNSIARIKKWHSMIEPYIFSENLVYKDTTTEFIDKPAEWGDSYKDYTIYTPGEMNYFTVRQKSIKDAKLPTLETTGLVLTLDAGDGYFWTGSGDGTHKLYCSFKSGDTFSNILSSGGFKGWTVWLNGDGLKYGYEREGRYYWPDWFCDANGDSVSNSTKFYESETIYTNWVDFTDVVVPYCFEDWGTITFTYNPEHFDSNVVGAYSENAEVYLMFPGSNWDVSDDYKLTRQNTGIYTKTFNWEQDIKPGFDSWNGYKFFIKEGDQDNWLGADVFTSELPDIFAQPDGDRNFRLVY